MKTREVWKKTQRTLSEPFLSLTVNEWMSSVFMMTEVCVSVCAFHRNDGEKKKSLNFMCQKKKKRGTLKERLLASAVALLL